MSTVFRWLPIFTLALLVSCQSSKSSLKNTRTDVDGTMDITISTMTKDAIRLKGRIEAVNAAENKRNSFDFLVQEIVKYGPTFSSAEPKAGELVTLLTPKDVTFEKGQVIIIDVLTPKFDHDTKPMRIRLGQP